MSVLLSAESLTIITSVVVFLIIIIILVVVILVAKSKLLPSGNVKIVINDEKELEVPAGGTLLGTLQQEKVYLFDDFEVDSDELNVVEGWKEIKE